MVDRRHKSARERWQLLEQVGQLVGYGRRKTNKMLTQDRIKAIRKRAGRF